MRRHFPKQSLAHELVERCLAGWRQGEPRWTDLEHGRITYVACEQEFPHQTGPAIALVDNELAAGEFDWRKTGTDVSCVGKASGRRRWTNFVMSKGKEQKMGWNFDNSYARLDARLFSKVAPDAVKAPKMLIFNRELASVLGLEGEVLSGPAGAELFSGNRMPVGSEPIAQAYAGHQFGHFTMLGDGRAHLLGEQLCQQGRFDIQLKGSGPTPFSRRGDGRAALGPMLREYVIGEAMHELGIATTRALAVVASGETIMRDRRLPGAVLCRVAASHLRVGTFEYVAARDDKALLCELLDYAIERHGPLGLEGAGLAEKAEQFLRQVAKRQACLIIEWMSVGFIHGVMNTDNMAISGETIDYGPCAFMEAYDPETVFSSIDRNGRYAFGHQAAIAQWNLARLAECLLPILGEDMESAKQLAEAILRDFAAEFKSGWLAKMRRKLGFAEAFGGDRELVDSLLGLMKDHRLDYVNTFASLSGAEGLVGCGSENLDLQAWCKRWKATLERGSIAPGPAQKLMQANNPAVIPRNHWVEQALAVASDNLDLGKLERLLEGLKAPYDYNVERTWLQQPAPASKRVYQTFCGT